MERGRPLEGVSLDGIDCRSVAGRPLGLARGLEEGCPSVPVDMMAVGRFQRLDRALEDNEEEEHPRALVGTSDGRSLEHGRMLVEAHKNRAELKGPCCVHRT